MIKIEYFAIIIIVKGEIEMKRCKYQIITYKEMCRILKRNGYMLDRQNGDHTIWVKDGCNHVSINMHLNPMVARRLVKENNLK